MHGWGTTVAGRCSWPHVSMVANASSAPTEYFTLSCLVVDRRRTSAVPKVCPAWHCLPSSITNFKPIFYFSLETIIKSIAMGWISNLCSIT